MQIKLLAVVAAIVALMPVAQAQTMIEYSSVATHSSSAALGGLSKLSTATGKHATDHYGTTKGRVWQEKNARLKDENPSKPAPPAVFILSNGERVESADYFATTDSLRVNQHGQQRTIPMSELNRSATVAANRERGVELRLPDNKAQITISF